MSRLRRLHPRLVLAFSLGLLASSCEDISPSSFDEDVSLLVCEINRTCDVEISGGVLDSLPTDFRCEDELMARFGSCGQSCQFRKTSARKCIRKLEKTLDDCETRTLGACRRAYYDCDESCNLWTCQLDPDARPEPAALGMMLLGLAFVRRRIKSRPAAARG